MKRLRTLVISLTLIAGSGLALSVTPAEAASPTSVTCGTVITTDTVLSADLLDCPGSGLVIGADDITLDLNGHVLDGDAVEQTECAQGPGQCDVGVSNLSGHRGITVKGGSVSDFSFGVYLDEAADNTLSALTVSASLQAGAELHGLAGGRVEGSTFTRSGLPTDGTGIVMVGSTDLVIEDNDITQNGRLGLAISGSSRNTIRSNHFADNTESAVLLDGAENTVTENTIVGNGAGIAFSGDRNRVSGNVLTDVPWCDYAGCSSAIQLTAGQANTISLNVIHQAPVGIDLESYEGLLESTVVEGNLVDSTRGTGIAVDVSNGDGAVVATTLTRNVVTRAGTSGLEVRSAATTLTANVAIGNTNLGIDAVAGVTDGGSNYAAGNGDANQCSHVRCAG